VDSIGRVEGGDGIGGKVGAATADVATGSHVDRWPGGDVIRDAQEAARAGFALRPDVGALVEALLQGGIEGLREACTLHVGVPMQPMLAKPATSTDELFGRIVRALPGSSSDGGVVKVTAEHKYDGQRAQIHRNRCGEIKIYSRKIDDMTYKYPDVVTAIGRCARSKRAFVVDAEIVAVMLAASSGAGEAGAAEIAVFQSLSTRKRKNVTEANAAASVAVKLFLFDLLLLEDEVLLGRPLSERRSAMREEFVEERDVLAFATAVDIDVCMGLGTGATGAEGETGTLSGASSAGDKLNAALHRAVADSCEGLMVKRLDSTYEPSTKRSDCWLKLKKDYLENMGDSLDLVPIGGWRGQGRKSRWVSPWLLATFDPMDGTFGSVCRVMSGFTDTFYKESTIRYLGHELKVRSANASAEGAGAKAGGPEVAADDGGDGDGSSCERDDAGEGDSDCDGNSDVEAERPDEPGPHGLLRSSPAPGVDTKENPQYWFEPTEVWEIRGADITISPKHMSARGIVDAARGLSLRFPRFLRRREDLRIADATTPEQLVAMFRKQKQQR